MRIFMGNKNGIFYFFNEFNKEVENNSDRGMVLVCGSIIDSLLADILKSFLVKKDNIDKKLFGTSKVLGTFNDKKEMAYYLGLISEYEYQSITHIQRIRNKFAHQIDELSFDNGDIKNMASNLYIPKNSYMPETIPEKDDQEELPVVDLNPIKEDTPTKDRFIYVFKTITTNLTIRARMGFIVHREEYDIEHTAEEILALLIEEVKKNEMKKKERFDVIYSSLGKIDDEERRETIKEYLKEIEGTEEEREETKESLEAADYYIDVIRNSLEK